MKLRDKYYRLLIAFVLIFFLSNQVKGQENTITTGASFSGNGTFSYSVGQVAYTQFSNNDFSISEGLQQAYEISIVTGIDDYPNIMLELKVYPNPVIEYLNIEVKQSQPINLKYRLLRIDGTQLKIGDIHEKTTILEMTPYTSAIYLLNIIDENKTIKTFKIRKY